MASPRTIRTFHLILGCTSSFLVAAGSIHCAASGDNGSGSGQGGGNGTSTGTGTGTGAGNGSGGDIGIDVVGADYSADQFFQNDPPPTSCDGGGQAPPVPGGTPECPDDKNLPGCACFAKDQTAPCWTGLRKNRNHGICHDGQTTCKLTGENDLTWGDCVGEQLPTGTTGKAACTCFSGGHWDIDNISPCYSQQSPPQMISTVVVNNAPACPPFDDPQTGVWNVPPVQPWSKDRLTVDCSGYFKLCYTLKAGDGANPQPGDCTIVSVCSEQYYSPANTVVEFPPLPAWLAPPAASSCVQAFINTGGYGEMSVVGESDECDHVQKVFQHVTYCPAACNDPNPPAMCAQCTNGGGGNF